jgi:hypothetical protein
VSLGLRIDWNEPGDLRHGGLGFPLTKALPNYWQRLLHGIAGYNPRISGNRGIGKSGISNFHNARIVFRHLSYCKQTR